MDGHAFLVAADLFHLQLGQDNVHLQDGDRVVDRVVVEGRVGDFAHLDDYADRTPLATDERHARAAAVPPIRGGTYDPLILALSSQLAGVAERDVEHRDTRRVDLLEEFGSALRYHGLVGIPIWYSKDRKIVGVVHVCYVGCDREVRLIYPEPDLEVVGRFVVDNMSRRHYIRIPLPRHRLLDGEDEPRPKAPVHAILNDLDPDDRTENLCNSRVLVRGREGPCSGLGENEGGRLLYRRSDAGGPREERQGGNQRQEEKPTRRAREP